MWGQGEGIIAIGIFFWMGMDVWMDGLLMGVDVGFGLGGMRGGKRSMEPVMLLLLLLLDIIKWGWGNVIGKVGGVVGLYVGGWNE